MPQLPDWAEHALNGSSHRVAERWICDPRDWVAGEVMYRGRELPSRFNRDGSEFIDLKVEAGTAAGGERQLAPGEWVRVHCGHTQLREWLLRDDPQANDKVAIRYEGRDEFADRADGGGSQHRRPGGHAG